MKKLNILKRVLINVLTSFITIWMLTNCVSTKVPKKEKRAKRKLEKHVEGLRNIVEEYPHLSDSLTTIVHDTLVIDSHVVETKFKVVHDTLILDSIISTMIDTTFITNDKIRYIRKEIIKAIMPDTVFEYSDSLLSLQLQFLPDGTLTVRNVKKIQKEDFIRSETVVNLDTSKPIYKYWEWWLLVVLLIFFIYLSFRRKSQNIVITNVKDPGMEPHANERDAKSP